jgi:hypothetical protein
MVGKASRGIGFLILLLLTFAIVGSFLGDLIKPYLPKILDLSFKIGAGPFPIDLKVLSISFGISINMNFMSIIGMIIALIVYKKGF